MNAVCLQETVHCTGDLALHDNHCRCVVSSLTNTVDVGDFYVLDHGGFIGPVFGECVISHSGGNLNQGWHRAFFPW